MNLRQKFLMMVAITSTVLVVVATMGYYSAKEQVTENIKSEMYSVANAHSQELNGWLLTKAQVAVITAQNIQSVLGDNEIPLSFVSHYKADSKILNLFVGLEDGKMIVGSGESLPAEFDPRKRGWYQQTKEKRALIFTDAYIDTATKKYVISATTPLNNATGNFRGAVGIDISLDFLSEKLKMLN